jgi:hypothetical protein
MTLGSPSNTHIPFTQRQSKSKVAAREILKKGESVRNLSLSWFCSNVIVVVVVVIFYSVV